MPPLGPLTGEVARGLDEARPLNPTTTGQAGPGHDSAGSSASLKLKAPAKINLTLAILGKRSDGFHEIESLVLPVALYDELVLEDTPEEQIRLSCDDPSLPEGPDNLVYRAAECLRRRYGHHRGVRVQLAKRIPARAGLGGGSSDAASTLIGLNELWRLGLTFAELASVAAELGSDVPLFVHGGPSIIRGRGEQVEPIRLVWPGRIVLVVPPFGMNTGEVYRHWRATDAPPRSADEVLRAHRSGDDLDGLLFNMLEEPAFTIEPRLAALRARLVELGAPRVRMSGSGAAMFALFPDASRAEDFAASADRHLQADVYVVRATQCEHL